MFEMDEMELSYGPVVFVDGPRKGQVGFYDDDEDGHCVVYVDGELMCGNYVICKPAFIRATTEYKCSRHSGKELNPPVTYKRGSLADVLIENLTQPIRAKQEFWLN